MAVWRPLPSYSQTTLLFDDGLDPEIGYAKHAISLDENWASFAHEKWIPTSGKHMSDDEHGTPWFEQVWFAGNHADIGGGYPEIESRLSDIALDWMTSCACEVPGGLQFDPTVLRRWPSHNGPQHDEVASGGITLGKRVHLTWPKKDRPLPRLGKIVIHDTVYDRFEAGPVPHWDGPRPYLSPPLADYPDVKPFFAPKVEAGLEVDRKSQARRPKRPPAMVAPTN